MLGRAKKRVPSPFRDDRKGFQQILNMQNPLVSIVMGSDSDLEIMNEAAKALKEFGIPYEIDITSAHRSPARTSEYSRGLKARGCGLSSAASWSFSACSCSLPPSSS